MHGYDTLRQLTLEHQRELGLTGRDERLALAARATRTRTRRARRAARLELLLGTRYAARLRAEG